MSTETITPSSGSPLRAGIGAHVELELIPKSGARERLAVDIVPDAQADLEQGFLGSGTPLARAILDHAAGTVVPYKMGDIVQVRVLSVTPSVNAPPSDAAEKRQALIRKAVDKSDLANAISFALSFDTKWGDYDPEGIAANWEQTRSDESDDKPKDEIESDKPNGST